MPQSSELATDYLRRIIAPEEHRAQLGRVLADLKSRASLLLVNHDLTEESPSLPPDIRAGQLADMDVTLEDFAWRIQRLEEDLKSLDKSTRNITGLNRARRRELEKAAKKVAKKDDAAAAEVLGIDKDDAEQPQP